MTEATIEDVSTTRLFDEDDDVGEVQEEIPDLDPALLATAFPELVKLKFSQDEETGIITTIMVNRAGHTTEVDIGTELPATTEELVVVLTTVSKEINMSEVDAVGQLLEGLDE